MNLLETIKIRIERNDYDCKSAALIYEDGSYLLSIVLELRPGGGGGWVTMELWFNKWTVPKGEPISNEKRNDIKRNIDEWAQNNNTSIHIEKGTTRAEEYARLRSKGWTIEELPNGGYKAIPPTKNE